MTELDVYKKSINDMGYEIDAETTVVGEGYGAKDHIRVFYDLDDIGVGITLYCDIDGSDVRLHFFQSDKITTEEFNEIEEEVCSEISIGLRIFNINKILN